jgi:hypothetical protein
MLLACQHGSPQGIWTRVLIQNQKTNPEQTLSVPVVFRNHLKFSEFGKKAEIIRDRRRGQKSAIFTCRHSLPALKTFWFMACGLSCDVARHQPTAALARPISRFRSVCVP